MALPISPGSRGKADNNPKNPKFFEQEIGSSPFIEISPLEGHKDSYEPSPQKPSEPAVAKAKTPTRSYENIASFTAEDALYKDGSRWAHLDERIDEMVEYVQGHLREHKLTEKVAAARKERGTEEYEEMMTEIDRIVAHRIANENIVDHKDAPFLIASVRNDIMGYGPLEPLWQDKDITEIMVNSPDRIYIERRGKIMRATGTRFRSKEHALELAKQILAGINRRLDLSNPLEDGSLFDRSRFNAVHTDIAHEGPVITIRRFPETAMTLKNLVDFGAMNEEMAEVIGNFVHSRLSVIVIGGTGSGKTSMLNALSGVIPDGDRVITIEDTPELRLHADKHVVSLVSRPAGANGEGAVTIRRCMINALRMRPDRIIVGESRDASAYDMLQAMNTGHEGSMTTVHANDAEGAVERIAGLAALSGELPEHRVPVLIASGVDIFIVVSRYEDGSRRVKGIYEVPSKLDVINGESKLVPIPLWEFEIDHTDEHGTIHGHYEQKNTPSESLIRKHSLDRRKHLSLEELYSLARIEGRKWIQSENFEPLASSGAPKLAAPVLLTPEELRPARPVSPFQQAEATEGPLEASTEANEESVAESAFGGHTTILPPLETIPEAEEEEEAHLGPVHEIEDVEADDLLAHALQESDPHTTELLEDAPEIIAEHRAEDQLGFAEENEGWESIELENEKIGDGTNAEVFGNGSIDHLEEGVPEEVVPFKGNLNLIPLDSLEDYEPVIDTNPQQVSAYDNIDVSKDEAKDLLAELYRDDDDDDDLLSGFGDSKTR